MQFSIIVPVYNVKEYLEICIESVLEQSYTDYEIIIVDDGSTDGSEKLCDRLQEKYECIQVIHQENKGLSGARNVACMVAKGNYLIMLDSDDLWVDKEALSKINKVIDGQDIIVFGWKSLGEGKLEGVLFEKNSPLKEMYSTGRDFLSDALAFEPLYVWYTWRYVFKREFWIFHEFFYPEGKKYEDLSLVYKVLLKAEWIGIIKEKFYGYRVGREGAITTDVKLKTELDKLDIIEDNIKHVISRKDLSNELKEALCNNFSRVYYSALTLSAGLKDKKEQQLLWNRLKECCWICDYSKGLFPKIVKRAATLIGISNTVKILNMRMKLKKYLK